MRKHRREEKIKPDSSEDVEEILRPILMQI